MLVLSRRKSERILIGDDIVIMVTDIRGYRACIGVEAPKDLRIIRDELQEQSTDDTERNDVPGNPRAA